MYKGIAQTAAFLTRLQELTKDLSAAQLELFVIPSFTTLDTAKTCAGQIRIGAQNMGWEDEGQFSGEISPLLLREIGVDPAALWRQRQSGQRGGIEPHAGNRRAVHWPQRLGRRQLQLDHSCGFDRKTRLTDRKASVASSCAEGSFRLGGRQPILDIRFQTKKFSKMTKFADNLRKFTVPPLRNLV